MFQVNSSLFICIICILVAPPDSKWFKPWFYSSCPLSWCMRVAKQFFDSPGSWLASNLCSSRPKTSGIVWLDVPHHSQDEKAGNPEGPQIRLMEKRWKEGRSLWESSAGQATTPTTQISWGAASLSQRFWVFCSLSSNCSWCVADTCALSHALTKHLQTSSLMAASMPSMQPLEKTQWGINPDLMLGNTLHNTAEQYDINCQESNQRVETW